MNKLIIALITLVSMSTTKTFAKACMSYKVIESKSLVIIKNIEDLKNITESHFPKESNSINSNLDFLDDLLIKFTNKKDISCLEIKSIYHKTYNIIFHLNNSIANILNKNKSLKTSWRDFTFNLNELKETIDKAPGKLVPQRSSFSLNSQNAIKLKSGDSTLGLQIGDLVSIDNNLCIVKKTISRKQYFECIKIGNRDLIRINMPCLYADKVYSHGQIIPVDPGRWLIHNGLVIQLQPGEFLICDNGELKRHEIHLIY